MKRAPVGKIIAPMKAVYTDAEAFDLLFFDERSRHVYREEKAQMNQNLIDNIRAGKVNPMRGWRVLKGMDRKTLAAKTGLTQPNLSRLEDSGAPIPPSDVLKKIASASDVSIKDLTIRR